MLPETILLDTPKDGLTKNSRFYLRMFVTYVIFGVLVTQQACARLLTLLMTTRRFVTVVVAVAAGIEVITYLVTVAVGFSMPFTIQIGTIPHVTLLRTAFTVSWYKRVRANRMTLVYIADALLILSCQSVLITLYPVYYYAFTNVATGPLQSAFSLLLPVLKILARNLLASACKDSDEHTPQIVVFNADIGNALFVSYCMQFNPSLMTTASLMAVNILQALLSLRDVSKILAGLKQLDIEICEARLQHEQQKRAEGAAPSQQIPTTQSTHVMEHDVVARAMEILQRYHFRDRSNSATRTMTIVLHRFSVTLWKRPAQVVLDASLSSTGDNAWLSDPSIKTPILPAAPSAPDRSKRPRSTQNMPLIKQLERQYLRSVLKLVYLTEFLVLIEYAEVAIPVIYSLYLLVMLRIPNRVYYSQFADKDSDDTFAVIQNVFLYDLVELGLLAMLGLALWYRIRFSTAKQLSFVLDRHKVYVQSALVLWVFYTTQVSLEHYGANYSFRFQWLH